MNKANKIAVLLCSLGVMGLTGCASNTRSDFSCPAPSSGMCGSVSTVDKMVTRGQIGQSGGNAHYTNSANNPWQNFSTPYPLTVADNSPLRTHDKVMEVWVAPFEDSTGNYHDASDVFAVIEKSHWQTHPQKAVGGEA